MPPHAGTSWPLISGGAMPAKARRPWPGLVGGLDPRRLHLQGANAVGEVALAFAGAGRGSALAIGRARPIGATLLAGEHGFDRGIAAFERDGEARDLCRDVVDALAQQRVLHPLRGPGLFRL